MDIGENISAFMGLKNIAVVGVSKSGKDFGATAFRELVKRGYSVTPVNRDGGTIDGVPMYRSLSEIKGNVDGVLVVVPPSQSVAVISDAFDAGISHVWLTQGAESNEAIKFCEDRNIREVHGECILMFFEKNAFPHTWHRTFKKITGRLPRMPVNASREA